MISTLNREEALGLIKEAVASGACRARACEEIGICVRTYERWVKNTNKGVVGDRRVDAVRPAPANKLTEQERAQVLEVVNSPRFAHLPPTQIVPILADEGCYVASESTIYRILHNENQMTHRAPSAAPKNRVTPRHCATKPNQLWAWDITWLPGPIAGMFFYLYLMLDVFSRKIVAHEVHAVESSAYAAELLDQAVLREKVPPGVLTVHQDNGSPMKGSDYVAKLNDLQVAASYSRPRVSDDNAYAESVFRTCKYRPEFPGAFASLDQARLWALEFVRWYNHEHKHRNLKFVSPAQRHAGEEQAIFEQRIKIYNQARAKHPQRWSRGIRNWSLPTEVWINKITEKNALREAA